MFKLMTAILALWLCYALNSVSAQVPNSKITGKILNENRIPVEGATVSLQKVNDSVIIRTQHTLVDGHFIFDAPAAGSYQVLVSSTGLLPAKSKIFEVNGSQVLVELPVITLLMENKLLQEVIITSKKPFLEHKIDRTTVNVDALISNAGTTALDVLEKSPGVAISQSGTISLHGKSGVAIYIDDKPTYLAGSDLENYLRSMPSALLDQIELMTNPPAKYDAAGVAGIINIKTKKNKIAGFNLGINMSLRQGHYSITNNSLDFNYRKQKVNVFGLFGYTLTNGFNDVDINRQYAYNGGQASGSFSQNSYIRTKGSGYNAMLGMDLYTSDQTTMGILFNGVIRSPNQNNYSKGLLLNTQSEQESSVISQNNEQAKFKNGSVNVNYKHDFNKKGEQISANVDYLAFATANDQLFINHNYDAAGLPSSQDQLNGVLPANIHIYTAKVDYSEPIGAGWQLESGIKTGYTNTDNRADYFNTIAGNVFPDYDKTNHFQYKEAINAGYVNMNKDFKKLSIQAGFRVENTQLHGHQLGNVQKADSSFNRSFTSIFPTLYLLYKLDTSGNHQLKLTYGRRIERPYYQDLNPFISPLDKYTFYIGNPYLLPSYSSNIEFGYSYKNRINITFNYINIRDRITETIEIKDGNYYDRPGNIGSTKLYDLNIDAGFEPAKWLSLQLSGDIWQIRQASAFYNGTLKNHSNNFSVQGFAQFKLNKSWILQTDGKYQGKQTDGQFFLAAKGRLNLSVSKKLSPSSTLKLSANDLLYTNINKGSIGALYLTNASFKTLTDSRAVILSLNMRFGKAVAGQRKHNQTGAGEEQDRVKH